MANTVTIVVDNSVIPSSGPYRAEHGFAALLELDGKRILIDTGQSDVVVHNLGVLGLHCRELDAVVLSHGHYDHTGGLLAVLQQRKKPLPVYGHASIFAPHYSAKGDVRTYVGIPFAKEALTAAGAEWMLMDEATEIFPGLWFSASIPRESGFEIGDTRLVTTDSCGCCVPDPLADDSALFHSSPQGLTVISGCAHSGFVNTVRHGCRITGARRMRGWIGGTHLGPVAPEQLNLTQQFIDGEQPDFIATGHCTGFRMMAKLHHQLGEKFIPAFIGTTISLD